MLTRYPLKSSLRISFGCQAGRDRLADPDQRFAGHSMWSFGSEFHRLLKEIAEVAARTKYVRVAPNSRKWTHFEGDAAPRRHGENSKVLFREGVI